MGGRRRTRTDSGRTCKLPNRPESNPQSSACEAVPLAALLNKSNRAVKRNTKHRSGPRQSGSVGLQCKRRKSSSSREFDSLSVAGVQLRAVGEVMALRAEIRPNNACVLIESSGSVPAHTCRPRGGTAEPECGTWTLVTRGSMWPYPPIPLLLADPSLRTPKGTLRFCHFLFISLLPTGLLYGLMIMTPPPPHTDTHLPASLPHHEL